MVYYYYISIHFIRYNMGWIANTEIVLDPNNSVIKRLWCTLLMQLNQNYSGVHFFIM